MPKDPKRLATLTLIALLAMPGIIYLVDALIHLALFFPAILLISFDVLFYIMEISWWTTYVSPAVDTTLEFLVSTLEWWESLATERMRYLNIAAGLLGIQFATFLALVYRPKHTDSF